MQGFKPLPHDEHIKIAKNGPYLVYGGIPVNIETISSNVEGGSWEWKRGRSIEVKEQYALCRCGASANKPFCDGTHQKIGFDGTETAPRRPFDEQATTLDGPQMVLSDVEALCAYARFCDNAGSIWNLIEHTGNAGVRSTVAHEASHCPSGRLVVRDKQTGKAIEPESKPSIGLVEDPAEACSGPLWARGGIRVEAADGSSYEIRNRVTLCRCGASQNKPFCDGQHAAVKFTDGL
ncbi:MAG: CDGSH iron-sulfur domain-containing protein [Candidatus Baltobacteraceae bacterium]